MNTEILSVAAITVISFLIAQGVKATALDNKWLPVICGGCGAILGCTGFLLMPDFPAGDPLTAIAVGIVSGLAATGTQQVFKQLTGGKKAS
ncbi:MAG: phage holin family protein [Oscillospiraceae bacterium]